MVAALAVAATAALATGCTRAGTCRFGASLEDDPVARQLALARCDTREERERLRREMEEHDRRQAQREHDARSAQADRHQALVRANPRAPQLGGTVNEALLTCRNQGGTFRRESIEGPVRHACRMGRSALFEIRTERDRIVRVETFFEGDDVYRRVAEAERDLGPADDVYVGGRGVRVWTWVRGGVQMLLTMYERGVWMTLIQMR